MPATEVRPMPASSLTRELIAGPAGKIETDINGGFVQTRVARRMKTARLVLVAAAVNRFRAEAVPHDTLVAHLLHATGGSEDLLQRFGLTPRELEIVSTIVAGYTNKDIAQKFSISEQTVKNHLHNIFDKLGVSDRLELALYALHHRIIEQP